DPELVLGGVEHRLAAIGLIEQHAEAWTAAGNPGARRNREPLEIGNALARSACPFGHIFELPAMIDGKGEKSGRRLPASRRPVDMIDRLVFAERTVRTATGEEVLQLLEGRALGRAQETRYGKGAAGIRPGRAGLERFTLEPAAQET